MYITNKIGIFAIGIIVAIMLSSLILGQTSGETGDFHINFKENDQLLPETTSDPDSPSQVREVEADYSQVGPIRTNKQWVNIGKWVLPEREFNCTIGIDQFNFWYQIVQEPDEDADPDFQFEVVKSGGTSHTFGAIMADPDDDEIHEKVLDLGDDYELDINDTFEIYFNYSGYEDVRFYYDNITYDSGFFGEQDFLYLGELNIERSDVFLEAYDLYGSDWNQVKEFCEIRVDDEIVIIDDIEVLDGYSETINGIEVETSIIHWDVTEGFWNEQEIEVLVTYSLFSDAEDRGVRKLGVFYSEDNENPVAVLKITPTSAIEGAEIEFNGSESHDEEGPIGRFVWSSDIDGELQNSEEGIFNTTELSVGEHTISLEVRDRDGAWSDKVEATVTIKEKRSNVPPEIELSSPDNGDEIGTDSVVLKWRASDEDGNDQDLRYDMYFGEEEDPNKIISSGLANKTFEVDNLEDGATYYWKVVVTDGEDDTESEIWEFTVTLSTETFFLPEIYLTSPANGSIFEVNSLQLIWTASDEDSDDLTFDLYLGLDPNATNLIAADLTVAFYSFSNLEFGNTYYWLVIVNDGTNEMNSEIWSFTVQEDQAKDDNDTNWYEEQSYQGGIAISAIAVVIIGVILSSRKREEYYDYDYDEWGDEEENDEEW